MKMENREIKFRMWDSKSHSYLEEGFSIAMDGTAWYDEMERSHPFGDRFILQEFTGLKDKNGKEIYEASHLRIRGVMGEDSQYKFDAIYKVNSLRFEGVSLSFVRLTDNNPDSVENCFLIAQSASFNNGTLCVDYKNGKHDHLAFNDTWGENSMHRTRWKEHHYTNDIEIVGSIYET